MGREEGSEEEWQEEKGRGGEREGWEDRAEGHVMLSVSVVQAGV